MPATTLSLMTYGAVSTCVGASLLLQGVAAVRRLVDRRARRYPEHDHHKAEAEAIPQIELAQANGIF